MGWYSKKILIENGQIFEKNWLSIEETTPHPRLIGSHRCYDIWCQMGIKTELSTTRIYKENCHQTKKA